MWQRWNGSSVAAQGQDNTAIGPAGVLIDGNAQADVITGEKHQVQTGDLEASKQGNYVAGGNIDQKEITIIFQGDGKVILNDREPEPPPADHARQSSDI